MKITTTILLSFFLLISAYSQSKADSIAIEYFKKLIPYDSLMAIQDLSESKIQILKLSGLGHLGEPLNTNEELELVEQRFGFKFIFDFIKAPHDLVIEKQKEYNNQVYRYLDSYLQIDAQNEISIELKRLAFERLALTIETDKQLAKRIKKTFRKESNEFKTLLISADIKYRDRKFKSALEEYEQLFKLAQTESGQLYLQTSEYHCKMNLGKYSEAYEMFIESQQINRVAKRIKTNPNKPL
ncbi:hypothetical protein KEM09_10635 [Carboxylicivirga mesophila]|uniref:Tetratricopeptide repeat protein n=1 Tax=Carboxylicivirga mesophila TaxID=1166478 RepID=A0ABS5KA75_9BACT|nr:hypothetical protein [Carboxylicivirga mesophila]MBS2211864.1 hypothetical protein [Carboxylicivirga mesophila]